VHYLLRSERNLDRIFNCPTRAIWILTLAATAEPTGAESKRVRAQLHVEFLNAFNRVVYANPNTDPTAAEFGKVTSQNNLPRDIQLAMKIVF